LEELWLFVVRTENPREDTAIFRYLKVPVEDGLKVSFKPESKRQN
jgi:hypothetical protein